MSVVLTWLNNHKYEFLNHINGNEICRIRDMRTGSKKILKALDVSELDSKVVAEVVYNMNEVNEFYIDGLLKYKLIEVSESSLYRISREYKVVLSKINPLKYFEDSGVYDILNRMLNVLNILNEIGLFHSDLKPSNIFLNDENSITVGDYLNNLLYKGREGKRIRKEDDLCFVSYDELLGLELDISSDIWNFGLIFYYVLSGKYAFLGSNISETILNILNVKYVELERGDDSEKMNSFLRKILIKEKKNRMKLNEIMIELKKMNESGDYVIDNKIYSINSNIVTPQMADYNISESSSPCISPSFLFLPVYGDINSENKNELVKKPKYPPCPSSPHSPRPTSPKPAHSHSTSPKPNPTIKPSMDVVDVLKKSKMKESYCVVCSFRNISCVYSGCGHFCVCDDCAIANPDKCPLCNIKGNPIRIKPF